MSELKLQETEDGELFFTIPDDILDRLGWKEGDEIQFIEQNNGFLLKRIKYKKISLDINDGDLLKYMMFAHEQDITFNQLCQNAIKEKLEELDDE